MDENQNIIESTQQSVEVATSQPIQEKVLTHNVVEPKIRTIPKWLYFFIILGILFPFPLGMACLIYLGIKRLWSLFFAALGYFQAFYITLFIVITMVFIFLGSPPGSEIIILSLFMFFGPSLLVGMLTNIIGLPIYITKLKPRGMKLVLYAISLIISVLPVAWYSIVFIAFYSYA